jgi:glycosyltransferase involved in cell wall biosynthesis
MPETVIVIPCYNEEKRLHGDELLLLLRDPRVHVLFVNDGSTDGTEALLRSLQASVTDRIDVLSLESNRGKAEAVRAGLLRALDAGARVVGFIDADLATPPDEVLRILDVIREDPALSAVMGSRVALLGSKIERNPVRHYLGRIFASIAAYTLKLMVYDTQCGAKFFRSGRALEAALAQPFTSRWSFDVELLGCLMVALEQRPGESRRFLEVPLKRWSDIQGSKLRPLSMIKATLDLFRIGRRLKGLRRTGLYFEPSPERQRSGS